jgi:hypothetical protein
MQTSIQSSEHVARVREQGFRRLVLGSAGALDSVAHEEEAEELLAQLQQQEPVVKVVSRLPDCLSVS